MVQQTRPQPTNTWRAVALFLVLIILLVGIGFSVPLVKVPVATTETYTETEYKEEAYTVVETVPAQTTTASTTTNSITFFDGTLFEMGASVMPDRWGTEVKFKLDIPGKTNPRVTGSWIVENFPFAVYVSIVSPDNMFAYQHKGAEASLQTDDFEFVPTVSGVYTMRFSSDYVRSSKYIRLTLALKWDEPSSGAAPQATITKEVIKYRQVPVQVQKQRTVVKHEKASVWQLLFKR
ncbi:MAG: hypothetical protein FJ008_02065 [Chloroflexi bacterium]|nr:hypothetical protein [Chloroflexota bacterium]MBM3172386.1 hypothetical protein [Chloroflexota bacterium]MBM3174812.1 hypothetical protein [Chloroflexota bacterium]MBM4449978.1 hypothetical protein [Chloroflexota bacterium]